MDRRSFLQAGLVAGADVAGTQFVASAPLHSTALINPMEFAAGSFHPMSRSIRQTDILTGNGGATYGPFKDFQIFDEADIVVFVRPAETVRFGPATVAVRKVNGLPLDTFTISFAASIPETTQFVVSSARIAERTDSISSNKNLDVAALERELSKISSILQELRRDVDRSLQIEFGETSQVLPPPEPGKVLGWSGNTLSNLTEAPGNDALFGDFGRAAAASKTAKDFLNVFSFSVWDSEKFETLQKRLQRECHFLDFGEIDPAGHHDSKAGIQRCLDQAGAANIRVRTGAGRFVVSGGGLQAPPVMIEGEGRGVSTIAFDSLKGADGLNFLPAQKFGQRLGITRMTLAVSGGTNGRVGVSTPKQADQYETYRVTHDFSDLVVGECPVNQPFKRPARGFMCWFSMGDSAGLDMRSLKCWGVYDYALDPATQPNDTLVRLDAASAIMTAEMRDIDTVGVYRAIEIVDRVFYQIEDCDFASAYEGIVEVGKIPYGEGWIGSTNLNVQHRGVYLNGADGRAIDGITVRRHDKGWRGETKDWTGIEIGNGKLATIKNALFHISENSGPFKGLHCGIQLNNMSSVIVGGVRHSAGLDYIARFSRVNGANLEGVTSLNDTTLLGLSDNSTNILIGPTSRRSGTKLGVAYQSAIDRSSIRDLSEGYLPPR